MYLSEKKGMDKMKHCVFCHQELENDAVFCTNCGKRQPENAKAIKIPESKIPHFFIPVFFIIFFFPFPVKHPEQCPLPADAGTPHNIRVKLYLRHQQQNDGVPGLSGQSVRFLGLPYDIVSRRRYSADADDRYNADRKPSDKGNDGYVPW